MSNEFDDALPTGTRPAAGMDAAPAQLPELIADVYRDAAVPLRTRLVECLLRPLGPLGLVAVAAGAFGALLQRGGYREIAVTAEDALRISPDQVLELARYVEQACPDSLLQLGPLLADSPLGMAGITTSVLLLTLQAWRQRRRPQR